MVPSVRFRGFGFLAFVVAAATPAAAFAATLQGQQMMKLWASSDRCVAAAQKSFPDYTAEALAKRDLAVQQCLASGMLPPRDPQSPQEPSPKP
jgi:hypothetical protein